MLDYFFIKIILLAGSLGELGSVVVWGVWCVGVESVGAGVEWGVGRGVLGTRLGSWGKRRLGWEGEEIGELGFGVGVGKEWEGANGVGEDDFFFGGVARGRKWAGKDRVWRRRRRGRKAEREEWCCGEESGRIFFWGRRCGVVWDLENKVGERGDGVVCGARGGRRRRRFGVGEGKSRFSFLGGVF